MAHTFTANLGMFSIACIIVLILLDKLLGIVISGMPAGFVAGFWSIAIGVFLFIFDLIANNKADNKKGVGAKVKFGRFLMFLMIILGLPFVVEELGSFLEKAYFYYDWIIIGVYVLIFFLTDVMFKIRKRIVINRSV